VTSQAEPFGVTLTSSYDAADRRTQVQDSLGGVLNSVYDNADRLTSRQLTAGSQQVRVDAGYDNRNDLTSLTRYSDVGGTTVVGTTVYSYDNAMRLTAVTNKNAAGTTLSYYNTAYDNADRATSDTWSSTVGTTTYSGTRNYSYDRSSQLLSDGVKSYTYDFNGNRLTAGTQTYQTAADNRMTTDGVWTYTYDGEGNLIQKTQGSGGSAITWNYGWDNLNRLTSVQEITGTTTTTVLVTYVYDVFGNRIQESKWLSSTNLTTVTRHAYDGQNIWADLNTSNGVLARYVYGDGVNQIWARAIPSGQPNAGVAWYLIDRLGSVRDLMDDTGVLQDHLDYDGYGNVTESNKAYGDQFQYAAGKYDRDTGLTQYNARYYDAASGRWISMDPLAFAAGDDNLYRYVHDNPTTATDSTGLYEDDVHFYMTYYIAAAIGLNRVYYDIGGESVNEAYLIAWAATAVDYNPLTGPTEGGNRARNAFHFVREPGQAVKAGSMAAQQLALEGIRNASPIMIGLGLHAFQDSYSHNGTTFFHTNPHYGFHYQDWPAAFDPPNYTIKPNLEAAMRMAKGTYDLLARYRRGMFSLEPVPYYNPCTCSWSTAYSRSYRQPDRTWDSIAPTVRRLLGQMGHPNVKEAETYYNGKVRTDS
jgi:RHS repeat-associated protein